jgi:hypothetical protein
MRGCGLLLLSVVALAAADLGQCRAALLGGGKDVVSFITDSGLPGAIGKPDECVLDLSAHYCLGFVGVGSSSIPWGVCMPRNCSFDVIKGFLDQELKPLGGKVQSGRCEWSAAAWTGGAVATVVVLSLFAAAGLAVTLMVNCAPARPQRVPVEEKQQLLDPINDERKDAAPAVGHLLVRAFDWGEAVRELGLPTPPALRAYDGLRTLAIAWIVLGHTLAFNQAGYDNPNTIEAARSTDSWFFVIVSIALRHVDTFFFLSGALLGYLVIRRVKNLELGGPKAVVFLIAMRLLRLWPLYLTWLFVWWQLAPLLASGPIASTASQQIQLCNDYGWANILYINNFWPVDFNSDCFGWSW